MELLLTDKAKIGKVANKKGLLNFTVNPEKWINKYLKSLQLSGALSVEQYEKIKAVGSKPGILYDLCKVHKNVVDSCPSF